MNDFERFYIGENPIYSLQQCKDSFEDLGLTRVSSSNRYSENLNPPMTEKTVKKPGEDGQYYFSTDLGATNHSINVAFDSLSEEQLRQLKQVQSSKSFWRLTYDNVPYKYYNVKPTGTSKLSYVPFLEDGARKYKGEGTLEFVCYEGCAHCWVDSKSEFYMDSAMTTPKKRFENIDEWKDSCGLFESKGYNFVSTQTTMKKTINEQAKEVEYNGTVSKMKGYFISNDCLEINLLQLGNNGKLEYNFSNSIKFLNGANHVYSMNSSNQMAKIKMDFSNEFCSFQWWDFNNRGHIIDIEEFTKEDAKTINKINWIIKGSTQNTLSKTKTGITQTGMPSFPYSITPPNFSVSSFDITEENGIYHFSGNLVVSLSFPQTPTNTVGVIRCNFYKGNQSLYYKDKQINPTEAGFSTTISFNEISMLEKPEYFTFDILFSNIGNYNMVKNTSLSGTLSQNVENLVDKTMSVEYLKENNYSTTNFTYSTNKGFYYINYYNFGDKDSTPNFTIENIPLSTKKIGIYIDESYHDDLTKYISNKENFACIFERTSPDYYFDNEKCLLLESSSSDTSEQKKYDIFTNQNITWGDFFKIEKGRKCFIYIVFLDTDDKPIVVDGTQKLSIKTNYLYY